MEDLESSMPDDVSTQLLLVEIAIEPKSQADQEKLAIALSGSSQKTRRSGYRSITSPARPF